MKRLCFLIYRLSHHLHPVKGKTIKAQLEMTTNVTKYLLPGIFLEIIIPFKIKAIAARLIINDRIKE